ncbi:hypothetical protein ATCC90586_007325 [Pythium insidiosum]|nr:hypothetical protein ATCC90586_007325 [Pythium insidiosum]
MGSFGADTFGLVLLGLFFLCFAVMCVRQRCADRDVDAWREFHVPLRENEVNARLEAALSFENLPKHAFCMLCGAQLGGIPSSTTTDSSALSQRQRRRCADRDVDAWREFHVPLRENEVNARLEAALSFENLPKHAFCMLCGAQLGGISSSTATDSSALSQRQRRVRATSNLAQGS